MTIVISLCRCSVEVQLASATGSFENIFCPVDAITLNSGKVQINNQKCDYDGLCIPACPYGAIDVQHEVSGGSDC